MGKREFETALAQVPLFSHLTKRQLRKLADLMEEQHFMADHTVVREGEPGDTFYVIIEGQAKVLSHAGRVVNRLLPGDFFGELALLDGGPRTATVLTDTPMTMLVLRRAAFRRMLANDPELGTKLLISSASLLRRLERSMSH